jgi:hypothetical protein
MFSDSETQCVSDKGLETYFANYPAGCSFRCVNHYKQLMLAQKFKKYDFGPEANQLKYG